MHKKIDMDAMTRDLFSIPDDVGVVETAHTPMIIYPADDWDKDGTYRHEVQDKEAKRSFYAAATVGVASYFAVVPPESLIPVGLSFAAGFGVAALGGRSVTKDQTRPKNLELIYCTDDHKMVVVNRVDDKLIVPVEFDVESLALIGIGSVSDLGSLRISDSGNSALIGGGVFSAERGLIARELSKDINEHRYIPGFSVVSTVGSDAGKPEQGLF